MSLPPTLIHQLQGWAEKTPNNPAIHGKDAGGNWQSWSWEEYWRDTGNWGVYANDVTNQRWYAASWWNNLVLVDTTQTLQEDENWKSWRKFWRSSWNRNRCESWKNWSNWDWWKLKDQP